MLAYVVALGLMLGQTPDTEETVGRIETVNKSTKSIGVRDGTSNARKLYYFNKDTSVIREGKASTFESLRVADTVSMKWIMKGSKANERRFLASVDVRHILVPAKLKIQEVGFLPLQDDAYHFVVFAHVDPKTVIVQEKTLVADPKYGIAGGQKTVTKIDLKPKFGEQFFLKEVKASDFPVGKRVSLDGRWEVKSSESAQVTKSSEITTEKVKVSGNRKTQDNLKKGNKTDRSGQADKEISSQMEKTKTVSGFVLVPVKGEVKLSSDG